MKIRIGTRKSELALFQANFVKKKIIDLGYDVEIVPIISEGDVTNGPLHEIGGKGLFVSTLEDALLKNKIDCAVHSLKDMPAKMNKEFALAAVIERESYADILVKKNNILFNEMPKGSIIGTSSPRRAAQILSLNKNIDIQPIRGNIATRLDKLQNESFDAIVVADAALNRLNIKCEFSERFNLKEMVPAASQGYIGIQCLNKKNDVNKVISSINSEIDMMLADAERSFVEALDGSCISPICILCEHKNNEVNIIAKVLSVDGQKEISHITQTNLSNLNEEMKELIELFKSKGAKSLIL
jgi:hydroxymethylbilane synthase